MQQRNPDTQPRLLVVDDNPDIHRDFDGIFARPADDAALRSLEDHLFDKTTATTGGDQYIVDHADQGQKALEMVKASLKEDHPYQVAFVDMRMPPGWDGVETIQHIWAVDTDIQVVICTAFSDYSRDQILQALGHTDRLLILHKPFDPIVVAQMAATLTRKWQLTQTAKNKIVTMAEQINERTSELRDTRDALSVTNEQLVEALEHAEQLAQQAQTASQTKSQFLANMSHEIRTPLNAILGFADILVEEQLNQSQCNYVRLIRDAGSNLLALINDILDLSKIEAGRLDIVCQPANPEEIIFSVSSMFQGLAQSHGITLTVVNEATLPESILTDATRVRQCLINVVGNALKFTEHGSVEVRASLAEHKQRPCVVLRVVDTGLGIPQDQLSRIFDAFTQVDASASRRFSGTGLGLTITQRLIQTLGGDIEVSSTLEKGSTFTLYVPFDSSHADSHTTAASRSTPWTATTDAAATSESSMIAPANETCFIGSVLVAEDNPGNQILMHAMLRRSGIDPVIVSNGQQAIQAVQNGRFDLIFMDMHMPVLNGYDATRLLRQTYPDLPIVALTASAMKGDRDSCLLAGCTAYLAKPISRHQVVAMLNRFLKHSDAPCPSPDTIPTFDPSTVGTTDDASSAGTTGPTAVDPQTLVAQMFNPQAFIDQYGDDLEAFTLVADAIRCDLPACMRELNAAIEQDDAKQLRFFAHRINGSVRNLCLAPLCSAFDEIESCAAHADIASARTCIDRIASQVATVVEILDTPETLIAKVQSCLQAYRGSAAPSHDPSAATQECHPSGV
jgi:signal transduction histidine kinase